MSIVIENLSYTYGKGTPYEKRALKNVNLEIKDGELLGIIGHTGCGKSTLIQHLNGLIRVQEGKITVNGTDIGVKHADMRALRRQVGLVFQYPEYQLFAETVEADVAFGLKNLGYGEEEVRTRTRRAIELVGLDYEGVKDRSPFDLSGGQKRRAAIAGVIAMAPSVLVLDEPTAGLDPMGKHDILELVKTLQKTCSPTVVMISHNMDEIADLADRIAVMKEGELLTCRPPEELFADDEVVDKAGLRLPPSVKIAKLLCERGILLPSLPVRKSVLAKMILERWEDKNVK